MLDAAGAFVLRLTARDEASDQLRLLAEAAQRTPHPAANAGDDQVVLVGATVPLDGSRSYDADGLASLAFAWTVVAAPAGTTATAAAVTGAPPSFVADRAGAYTFQLRVTEGGVTSAPEAVVVTANAPAPTPTLAERLLALGLDGTDAHALEANHRAEAEAVLADTNRLLGGPVRRAQLAADLLLRRRLTGICEAAETVSDELAIPPAAAWTRAETELQLLYGRALLGLAFLDGELRVLRASEGLAQLLGASGASLAGASLSEAPVAGVDALATAARRALHHDEPVLALPVTLPAGTADVDFIPVRGNRAEAPCLAVIATPHHSNEPAVLAGRRAALAELLARLTRRLLDVDPGSLLPQVERELAGLAGVLRLDYALIGAFSEEPGQFARSLAFTSPWVPSIEAIAARLSASTLPWASAQLRAGSAVLAYRLADLPPEGIGTRRLLGDLGLQSLLALPLVVRGQAIGVLALARRSADPGDPGLTFWLRLVADVVASALERARVEEERARLVAELEVARELLEDERDDLREELGRPREPGPIIAHSPAMRAATELLRAVAASDATVLLQGETGVGKELFAGAIHASSLRARGPFVRVNCAAIPRELFESEFFGHTRGAFTGALKDRKGRFELARGGTLFLDEVGEIPLDAQAKLLRVLESGAYERVGDGAARRADARVVAATNRSLEQLVREGRFREDLFYRLSVFPITVPALRERREDLPALARNLLGEACRRFRREPLELGHEALARLLAYPWPGNVRELRNVLERAVLLSTRGALRLELPPARSPAREAAPPPSPATAGSSAAALEALEDLERAALEGALRAAGGRIAGEGGAAALAGLPVSTFRDRARRLGLVGRKKRP